MRNTIIDNIHSFCQGGVYGIAMAATVMMALEHKSYILATYFGILITTGITIPLIKHKQKKREIEREDKRWMTEN